MNAPLNRRGACPTLRAPMQTGDGLLARLYPVDGGLTPTQLIGLAMAAERHGNGILEITQRGSLQIRGLTEASTSLFAAEVDALGIAVRDGVPVETGPLAGLDPDEFADPRPLAKAIRDGIAKAGLAGRLGPKVTVVIDGGGSSGLSALKADVRVVARPDGHWCVALGCDEMQFGELAAVEVAKAAVGLLREIAKLGKTGRGSQLAAEGVRSMLPPSVLPDISPARGEIGLPLGSRQSAAKASSAANWAATGKLPISPLAGEMSGRTEGGNVERSTGKVIRLRDGRFAAFCALPLGSVEAGVLSTYVEATASAGVSEFRLAPNRALIALCPSQESIEKVTHAARAAGLVIDAADPRCWIVACPGSPACASGHIPARAMAASIAASLSGDGALDLHVSGCAKRCAAPSHRGLTLLGTADGVALVLDGSTDAAPLAHVAKERAEAAFKRVAAVVSAERRRGETATDALVRIGERRLAAASSDEAR